jgi:hypothetical protein
MGPTLALDLSDGGLFAVAGEGVFFGPSPGYALAEGQELLVGEAVLGRARLRPRFVHSRFWERLDTEPLGTPFADGLSAADLVHAHLRHVFESARGGAEEVVLAVPGVHDERRLGRLLGITQALKMPVVGLVDAALAAASSGFPGERLLHVDLDLHSARVTELRQGHEIVRERVARLDRFGQEEVREELARRIAEAFVRETRFDPLHAAETEQALYDALSPWLARIARGTTAPVAIGKGKNAREIDLTRAEAEAWAQGFVLELGRQVSVLRRPGEPVTLLVAERAARVPGLVAHLADMRETEVALLPEQAAAAGALREREAVRTPAGALRYVTRLPRRKAPHAEGSVGGSPVMIRPPARPPRPDARRPTHVLLANRLRAITDVPLVVGSAPPETSRGLRLEGETAGISRAHCRLFAAGGEVVLEDLSTYGTFVNGQPVSGRTVVSAGDRVQVGSVELLLVAAEE